MTNTVRLILAEDDDFLRQLLQLQCESLGAEVAAVANGEEAVSLALSYGYDLLLMDIQMPVCDGIQAMTMLRQLGYERPIYAMSADKVAAEGFTAVLTKPLKETDLQALLQQHQPKAPTELVVAPELRQQFLNSLTDLHQQMQASFEQQNWQELQRLSHKLKGSAGSFGYPAISELADQLQAELQHRASATAIEALLRQLFALLSEVNHG
ncbi:MAG: response regulator [Alkalimonas sp.]|nr:response regulator [Alkalimonas sp.]